MQAITPEERLRRRKMVDSAIGTHEMEGMFSDAPTLDLLERYASGELSMQQFSAAMDAHARDLIEKLVPLAGAA